MNLKNKEEYEKVMKQIEVILQKSTDGGLSTLSEDDKNKLESLSIEAEKFEDSNSFLPL
jgi:hypothetical protein